MAVGPGAGCAYQTVRTRDDVLRVGVLRFAGLDKGMMKADVDIASLSWPSARKSKK